MYEKEKRELSKYLYFVKEVSNLEDKIRKLRTSIEDIGSQPSDVEHIDGGLHKTRSETIAQLVDFEDEWCFMLRRAETECLNIKKKINRVSEEESLGSLILFKKFINGLSLENIANDLGYSIRQIFNYYNKALRVYSKLDKQLTITQENNETLHNIA